MPPKVTKQTVKKPTKATKSISDRIVKVGQFKPGLRLTIYGRGKTGKTRLFSTFPTPSIIMGTEDGTLSIASSKGIDFIRLEHSSDVEEVVELCKEGKYRSICLDHGGGLQDLVLQEILGLEEIPVQKDWGMAKREDWATCGLQVKERLRSILTLAETRSMDVMIMAHERNFNDEGGSDLIFPTVGAALSPSVTNWLNGATDYVCQTFIREQVIDKTTKVGGKIVATSKKTNLKEYCLRIGPHPVYMTGFRTTKATIPEVIVDPTWAKIAALTKD